MAELGAQIMTISEERLAKWRSQRDPTYVAPTSFRVLATVRGMDLAGTSQEYPLIDKILTEEELHVASRLGQGTMLLDVAKYLLLLGRLPRMLDMYATLQYNPEFYNWFLASWSDMDS